MAKRTPVNGTIEEERKQDKTTLANNSSNGTALDARLATVKLFQKLGGTHLDFQHDVQWRQTNAQTALEHK